jgi:trehalose-phosphatase
MARDSGPRARSARDGGPAARAALEAFFASLATAPRRVLLLDYDGTLAPFRAGRDDVVPYPALVPVLRRLAGSGATRIGLLSGRPVADLAQRLRWLTPLPELWGSHGLERLSPRGVYSAPPVSPQIAGLLDRVEVWARENGGREILERKPFGLALHRRADPGLFAIFRDAFRRRFGAEARRAGLSRVSFDGGVELRPAAEDKGRVVRAVLEEEGPAAAFAYLGDDATDEDAFGALKGRGLAVLVRPRWRRTAADAWLRPPEDVFEFLRRWERTTASEAGPVARSGP